MDRNKGVKDPCSDPVESDPGVVGLTLRNGADIINLADACKQ